MARVFGGTGEGAGRESGAAFKRMFATLLVLGILYAVCEGVTLAMLRTHRGLGLLFLSAITGIFLWWLAHYANRRGDGGETARRAKREEAKG
jgi:hypothetical protein